MQSGKSILWILFSLVAGLIFLVLACISYTNQDLMWRIFNLEKGWRERGIEHTPEWDAKTKNSALVYAIIGLIAIALSLRL